MFRWPRILGRSPVLPIVMATAVFQIHGSALASTATVRWAATTTPAFSLSGMTDVGAASGATPMNLMVTLDLRNRAALDSYFQHITTPGDPLYQHYLRPDQFTSAYGPSMSDASAVIDYLHYQGFTKIELSANHTQIRMQGTVAEAQAAFNTQIHTFTYQGKSVLSNVTTAQVPARYGSLVQTVVGLNTVPLHWHNHPKAAASPALGAPGTNSFGYGPTDFQKVYDVGNTKDGSNVAIAIIADGDLSTVLGKDLTNPDDKTSDLRLYEDNYKIPHVPLTLVKTGYNPTDASGADEFDMDTQTSSGLANNLKMLYVYDGSDLSDVETMASMNRFITDNKAVAASFSVGGCEYLEQEAGYLGPYDQIFLQMATQGQTMFVSAGDNGAACVGANGAPGGPPGVEFPASMSNVMALGGTTLTANTDGTYDTEIVWIATGAGTSLFQPAGAWQKAIMPTSSASGLKNVPDMAMDGDENTGAMFYSAGALTENAGTSLASPLALGAWARMQSTKVAATGVANPLGFAPPDLYALGVSMTDAATGKSEKGFHDIIVGSNGTFEAAPGFDIVSGLGSFDIAAVSAALTKVAPALAAQPALGGDVCSLPGDKISLGTAGTNADAPNTGHTALATYFSENYKAGQVDSYTFSLDVDAINATQTVYFIYFTGDDGMRRYVAYETTPDPSAANQSKFSYGHVATMLVSTPTGLQDAVFVETQDGFISGATSTVTGGSRISMTLPRSLIPAIASSKALNRIYGEVDIEPGFLDQGGLADQLQTVNATDEGVYSPDPTFYCFPVPVAALTLSAAKVAVGTADTFNASTSTAATGETVTSYRFDFGDGTIAGPQAASSVMHTYATAGTYTATVVITDTSGKANTNTAAQTVTVTPPPPPTAFTYAEKTGIAVKHRHHLRGDHPGGRGDQLPDLDRGRRGHQRPVQHQRRGLHHGGGHHQARRHPGGPPDLVERELDGDDDHRHGRHLLDALQGDDGRPGGHHAGADHHPDHHDPPERRHDHRRPRAGGL